ncbi:MAG: hypothetical protein SF066_06965 [Thermoanaerobaculia bacterium]|nr:hypothetical protein [Thermoanaerobaculia bacterium]
MSSPLLRWLAALALLLGLVAHWWYWYQPKERAGIADPQDLPARVFADPAARFALWLPYPHQNLAAAADACGNLEDLAGAMVRRAGGRGGERVVALPRFGPFIAPPARELAASWQADGGVVLTARVYPALALIAKLAGRVAGNPWLAGGTVELDGRAATVEWLGSLWLARTAGTELPPAVAHPAAPAPSLGAFHLATAAAPLPAGEYRLTRTLDGGLEALLVGAPPPAVATGGLARADAALLLIRGGAVPEWHKPYPTPGALMLSAHLSSSGLPISAVFHPVDQPPWKLPARGLAELFGGEGENEEIGGLRLAASDTEGLASGRKLLPEVAPWLGARRSELVVALWLDPRAARKALSGASRVFEELPFLGHRREAEALGDWRTLLSPFEDFSEFSMVVLDGPPRAALRLTRH